MIIQCKNLSKKYGKFHAVENANLEFNEGEIVGLLGPNGSGKTTIIKMLNSILPKSSGEIFFEDTPISYKSDVNISYLPDCEFLNQDLSFKQLSDYYKDFFDDFDENKCSKMLNSFEIPLDKKLKHLSLGMKKKVQIALCISRNAKIYFLDEPLGGIDMIARNNVINAIVDNYNTNACLVISTHLISEVENILDRVILLKEGKIILDDSCENIREKKEKSISSLYMEVYNA